MEGLLCRANWIPNEHRRATFVWDTSTSQSSCSACTTFEHGMAKDLPRRHDNTLRKGHPTYLGLWGMCSPLSMLHTRSKEPLSNGVFKASATYWRYTHVQQTYERQHQDTKKSERSDVSPLICLRNKARAVAWTKVHARRPYWEAWRSTSQSQWIFIKDAPTCSGVGRRSTGM